MDNKKLIDTIASSLGKRRDEVAAMSDALCSVICDVLMEGDSISVPSVGSFESRLKPERIALHPASGKRLMIPPKLSVVFKPSSLLKQKIR